MTAATMNHADSANPSNPTFTPARVAVMMPVQAKLSWSPSDDGERLLRISQLTAILGISRATIYRYIASGKLPKPVKLSARCVAWKASVISGWMAGLEC
jgi:prophage regulatory protein